MNNYVWDFWFLKEKYTTFSKHVSQSGVSCRALNIECSPICHSDQDISQQPLLPPPQSIYRAYKELNFYSQLSIKKNVCFQNPAIFWKKVRYFISAILTEYCIIPKAIVNYLRLRSEACALKATSFRIMCFTLQSSGTSPQFSTTHKHKRRRFWQERALKAV